MFDETVALFWFLACFNFQLVTFQDQQTKQKQKLPVQDPHWVILMGISFFVVYFGIASTKDSQQIIIGGRNSLNKKMMVWSKFVFKPASISAGHCFDLPIYMWASIAGGPPSGANASSSSRPAAPDGPAGIGAEAAAPVRKVKIYSTPQEVLMSMMPPGCRMVLNFNDHRFMTTWIGPETKAMPDEIKGQNFQEGLPTNPGNQHWLSAMKGFGQNGLMQKGPCP